MQRYKIKIEYEGTPFVGWQFQKNGQSVQEVLQKAIFNFSKENVVVTGAGRTDSGVHALGQVAHFDINTRLNDQELKNAINFYTSKHCKIMSLCKISSDFDSRHDALKRTYVYQLYLGSSILYNNQAWLVDNIDLTVLKQSSKLIIGEHDFLSFSKNPVVNQCAIDS